MNVLFVSQCAKRALTETRRILTSMPSGAETVPGRRPLPRPAWTPCAGCCASARKNTAVACHWIRGRDHSELLWIVGDARQFNAVGAVPTNTTASDVLRVEDESHWHHLPLMTALTALAALMHDLGKRHRRSRIASSSLACGSAITIVMNGCRCACSRPLWAMTTMRVGCVGWPLAPMRTRKHRLSRGNGWIPKEAACCATVLTSRRLENACLLPRCRRWLRPWPGWC